MPDASSNPASRYAPGARVEVRDEEWMVRRVEPSATGGRG